MCSSRLTGFRARGEYAPMQSTAAVTFSPDATTDRVLTPDAVEFLEHLHRKFDARRVELLELRRQRQNSFDEGILPGFLQNTVSTRLDFWRVAPAPAPLADRRVEITGPTDRKMMINALNSGAKVFMADLEDSTSPTWQNVLVGQVNLADAVRGAIELSEGGKEYRLGDDPATLMVRPRGWHLSERHFLIDGSPISASLFDFGLYVFHCAEEALARGFGPYFYLPKLESHLEARLWNDVMVEAEKALGIERGSIRVTVLIETITAAFEMEEILYELRSRITGLNAGRWDYIFSIAKKFASNPKFVLPDRSSVTMTTPFMQAYTELLVKTCHRRGAHAIGGMSAFIPNRRKPEITAAALEKVAEDKRREATEGCDGTWVAHPDLIATARAEFDAVLGERPNQLDRSHDDVDSHPGALLKVSCPPGGITLEGLQTNLSVGIRYLVAWLSGTGAVAIDDLMEDAATAEISRSQVWQWVHHHRRLANGPSSDGETVITAALVRSLLDELTDRLVSSDGGSYDASLVKLAREVFESVALADEFPPFLTIAAYEYLD